MKCGQNVCFNRILDKFDNRSFLVKNSLGEILQKLSIHCKGQIFSSMFMECGQNVCLSDIWDNFKSRSCQVKNLVTRSNLRKILFTL